MHKVGAIIFFVAQENKGGAIIFFVTQENKGGAIIFFLKYEPSFSFSRKKIKESHHFLFHARK